MGPCATANKATGDEPTPAGFFLGFDEPQRSGNVQLRPFMMGHTGFAQCGKNGTEGAQRRWV